MLIYATRTLDCASKTRIHYRMPEPLCERILDIFPEAEVVVNRFSKRVAGARDHFVLSRTGGYHIAGILGDVRIVATFGKTARDGDACEHTIARFESALCSERFGQVVQRVRTAR
ncbi:MAG: hypothetical protein V3V08_23020 [Nannocystaceae bacterium]